MSAEVALPGSLDVLLAEQACRELVLRSVALIDAGDARGLALLFSAEAELIRPGAPAICGRAAIERAYRERPSERLTTHLICGTLFDELGPAVARASSRVLLWVADASSVPGAQGRPATARQLVGSFHDSFERTSDGWRIRCRRAVFEMFRG